MSLRELLGDEQQEGDVRHLIPSASPRQSVREGLRSVSGPLEETTESPESGPAARSEESDPKGKPQFRVIKGGKED